MNLNTYNLPDSYHTYMAARDPAVDAYYTFRERKRPLKDTKTYCLWSQRTLEEKQPVIRTPYYQDYWAQKLMARRRETREAFAFGHAADGDGVLFFHPEDHGIWEIEPNGNARLLAATFADFLERAAFDRDVDLRNFF